MLRGSERRESRDWEGRRGEVGKVTMILSTSRLLRGSRIDLCVGPNVGCRIESCVGSCVRSCVGPLRWSSVGPPLVLVAVALVLVWALA